MHAFDDGQADRYRQQDLAFNIVICALKSHVSIMMSVLLVLVS